MPDPQQLAHRLHSPPPCAPSLPTPSSPPVPLDAELHFSPGCSATHQAARLRVLQASAVAAARLRRLANCRLGPATDLSAFAELESVSGCWECGEAGVPPVARLPPSLRRLELTGSLAAVLDDAGLLARFSGSLTAGGFSGLRLPACSRPLQVDWAPGRGPGSGIAIGNASLQLGGGADRLFLRLPAAQAAGTDAAGASPAVVHLGSCWVGQATLVVIDLRPAGTGPPDACASGSATTASQASAGPAAPQLHLAFPGSSLADLFSGALGAASAAGLRRLEVLCGPGMRRFDHAALCFVACTSGGTAAAQYSLRDLLHLPAVQRAGWRVTLAAEPWRLVLARQA